MANGGAHVAVGAGLTPLIAQVLQYATAWPLQPLDEVNSMAIAGLVVAIVGGGGLGIFGSPEAAAEPGPPGPVDTTGPTGTTGPAGAPASVVVVPVPDAPVRPTASQVFPAAPSPPVTSP